jgi:hypothetical protein
MGWNRNDRALRQFTGIAVISKASATGRIVSNPSVKGVMESLLEALDGNGRYAGRAARATMQGTFAPLSAYSLQHYDPF